MAARAEARIVPSFFSTFGERIPNVRGVTYGTAAAAGDGPVSVCSQRAVCLAVARCGRAAAVPLVVDVVAVRSRQPEIDKSTEGPLVPQRVLICRAGSGELGGQSSAAFFLGCEKVGLRVL